MACSTARALENFHISGVELRLYPDSHSALWPMVKLRSRTRQRRTAASWIRRSSRHRRGMP
jgi:hypothetical protein